MQEINRYNFNLLGKENILPIFPTENYAKESYFNPNQEKESINGKIIDILI